MDIVRVSEMAARECLRQQVGLDRVAFLLEAYNLVQSTGNMMQNLGSWMSVARIVEPTNNGQFRNGAVTFQNGGVSTPPGDIPFQMGRLFSIFDWNSQPISHEAAYEFVKSFELIHPFSDGNGRVGWLLYNYLAGTMDSPVALPDFDF